MHARKNIVQPGDSPRRTRSLAPGAGRSGDPSRCAPLDGARRAADRCPAAPAGFLHRQCRAAGHARRPGGQCSHVANGHFRVCRCVCRHADPGRPARRPVRPPARFHLRHAGVRRVVGAVRAGHVPRCAGGRPPAAGADRRRHGAAAAGNDPRPFSRAREEPRSGPVRGRLRDGRRGRTGPGGRTGGRRLVRPGLAQRFPGQSTRRRPGRARHADAGARGPRPRPACW